MIKLLEKLNERKPLIADGAMGSLLMAKGMKPGECPELLNLDNPEIPEQVAKEYFEAGAEIIQTNSFGGSAIKLSEFNQSEKTEKINFEAARIVKYVVGDNAYVSGSVGPTGKMLEPFGDCTESEMIESFKSQIKGLVRGGVDIICIETMSDLAEAVCAMKAVKSIDSKLPIAATMTFNKMGDDYFTMMGVSIEAAVKGLIDGGADIVGSNCGNGIDNMIEIAESIKSFTDKPVLIQSNAGLPEVIDGNLIYPEVPQYFAERAVKMFDLGVSIVGGCCGTTPEYIAAIKKQLNH
jgi:5-methyltetrahydrofolate--homocysteine methyltransferase